MPCSGISRCSRGARSPPWRKSSSAATERRGYSVKPNSLTSRAWPLPRARRRTRRRPPMAKHAMLRNRRGMVRGCRDKLAPTQELQRGLDCALRQPRLIRQRSQARIDRFPSAASRLAVQVKVNQIRRRLPIVPDDVAHEDVDDVIIHGDGFAEPRHGGAGLSAFLRIALFPGLRVAKHQLQRVIHALIRQDKRIGFSRAGLLWATRSGGALSRAFSGRSDFLLRFVQESRRGRVVIEGPRVNGRRRTSRHCKKRRRARKQFTVDPADIARFDNDERGRRNPGTRGRNSQGGASF
ncbi:MAG: hypothetical protein QOG12_992 [Verrucomicrobiota bacterium]